MATSETASWSLADNSRDAAEDSRSRQLYRGIGAVGILVGLVAAFTPRLMLRVFGMDPDRLTGEGAMGWRLFAARNLVVGGAIVSGSRAAEDMVLAVQGLDQAVFWTARARGEIPTRAAVMASATSGVVIALGILARRRSRA